MSKTFHEIVTIVRQRQLTNSRALQQMIEVKERYNGDWVIPFVSEEEGKQLAPLTPQLIADAVDNNAMRAASVRPDIFCPAINDLKESGIKSRDFATRRRRALDVVWAESFMPLQMRKAYRHLFGYSAVTFNVSVDTKTREPRIQLRDPLATYPAPKAAEDFTPPENCAFVYGKNGSWLRAMYPRCRSEFGGPVHPEGQTSEEQIWDLVEWIDEDEIVCGIMGQRPAYATWTRPEHFAVTDGEICELYRYKNLAGRCTVVTPQRITLDRVFAQLGTLTGHVDTMARLMALNIAAAEKSIFPDRYAVADPNTTPTIVGGEWKDGRTGEMNLLTGIRSIGNLANTPDQAGPATVDRLERNFRLASGLSPGMQGETYGSLRTGRGIDSMLDASVEPRIQEAHEIMSTWLTYTNEIVLDIWKAAYPSRTYHLFSGRGADATQFEFTPNKHIETTKNLTSYPVPGADIQGTTIRLGQLQGMGAISMVSLRRRHPDIDDPDAEQRRVDLEALEQATLQAVGSKAANGEIPPTHIARIAQAYRKGAEKGMDSIIDAVIAADEELAKEQAAAPPPPEPGQVAPPEMMPGLNGMPPPMAPPDPAAFAGPATGEIGPADDQRGLRRLLESLSAAPPTGASTVPEGMV